MVCEAGRAQAWHTCLLQGGGMSLTPHRVTTALREYITSHGSDELVERINAVCDEVDTSLPQDLARLARNRLASREW